MTVAELIEKLLECSLDAPVTVFFNCYVGGDYEQGEETPVLVVDGDYVMIAAESEKDAAEYWMGP